MNKMVDTKVIDNLRHNHFLPLYQSLKAHTELSNNNSFHISPMVLKDVIRRIQAIETEVMNLMNDKNNLLNGG